MAVKAIHALTGKVALVSEGELASNPHLTRATDAQIADAQRAKEIKVYGAPLAPSGELPADVLGLPDEHWTKADLIAYAEHKKIEVDKSVRKDELLAAILEGAN